MAVATARIVLANGSMLSHQSGEGDIRKNGKFRDRRGEILFIDARKLGRMVDRTHRELTAEDIKKIAATYHACGEAGV